MPVYVWKGRTMAGESQAGEVTFERQEEAMDFLRKKRIMVTSMKEKSRGFKLALPQSGGVSTKDMAIFTRQFATMISAGLPLVQCLDILASQTAKPAFAKVIADVTREVGDDLGERRLRGLRGEDVQALHERQAGRDRRRRTGSEKSPCPFGAHAAALGERGTSPSSR